MGGASIPVYIILWIVVPKAKTTAQKLEMQGKEATVTNIAQSIKDDVGEVKDNYDKFWRHCWQWLACFVAHSHFAVWCSADYWRDSFAHWFYYVYGRWAFVFARWCFQHGLELGY